MNGPIPSHKNIPFYKLALKLCLLVEYECIWQPDPVCWYSETADSTVRARIPLQLLILPVLAEYIKLSAQETIYQLYDLFDHFEHTPTYTPIGLTYFPEVTRTR